MTIIHEETTHFLPSHITPLPPTPSKKKEKLEVKTLDFSSFKKKKEKSHVFATVQKKNDPENLKAEASARRISDSVSLRELMHHL